MIRFELQLSLTQKKKSVYFSHRRLIYGKMASVESPRVKSLGCLLFCPYLAWQGVGDGESGGLLQTERRLGKLRLWWQATTHLF